MHFGLVRGREGVHLGQAGRRLWVDFELRVEVLVEVVLVVLVLGRLVALIMLLLGDTFIALIMLLLLSREAAGELLAAQEVAREPWLLALEAGRLGKEARMFQTALVMFVLRRGMMFGVFARVAWARGACAKLFRFRGLGVSLLVERQVIRAGKRFDTKITFEWPVAGVLPLMSS